MSREEAKRRAELYQALADGKTLQVHFGATDEWRDIDVGEPEEIKRVHEFMSYQGMLRIKPERKKAWYRVGLMKFKSGKYFPCVCNSEDIEAHIISNDEFVEWLTDRIEYELPEGDE